MSYQLNDFGCNLIIGFEGLTGRVYVPRTKDGSVLPADGITVDPGVCISAMTVAQWLALPYPVDPSVKQRLVAACGITGPASLTLLPRFADIRIAPDVAKQFFRDVLADQWQQQTNEEFPGSTIIAMLAPDAFAALVSLVYNRGDHGSNEHRTDMLATKDAVEQATATSRIDRAGLVLIGDTVIAQAPKWQVSNPGVAARRIKEGTIIKNAALLADAV